MKRLNCQPVVVLAVSTVAFISFYFNAYFSHDFKGMLGYETKDTIAELTAYFTALDQGATLYWDPCYFYYTPTFPQAPLYSPVTVLFIILHKLSAFSAPKSFFGFYLLVLAVIQILCVYTMYVFLRWCGLKLLPSVLGGLAYAYNQQTFVFGIRHGYERISAVLLAPLFLLCFLKVLDSPPASFRYRKYIALTSLLFGLSLICNGDVKPTLFFAWFMVIAVFLKRPFILRNTGALVLIFIMGGAIFSVQGLLTGYAYSYTMLSHESLDTILEYSLRPIKLLLTHIATAFTDRPDYPWENTVEFSLSFLPLVVLGMFYVRRTRLGLLFGVTLIFCYLWIMGRYTCFSPVVGFIGRVLALHHPARMAMLLYFCYGFFIAVGVNYLTTSRYDRIVVSFLSLIPAGALVLYLGGHPALPLRYIGFAFLSYAALFLVTFRLLRPKFLWLIALGFVLERTTIFANLKSTNPADPTEYYSYDEIYTAQPRVKPILEDPDYRQYRAFFGAGDFPDLFSHNFYLNSFSDRIRPLFAYFYLDHEWSAVSAIKYIVTGDWSHPMWDLLNVKYLVDADRYIDLNTDRPVRMGLDHLLPLSERVKVNPGVEKEIFIRYTSEPIADEESFLRELRLNKLDVKNIAYINSQDKSLAIRAGQEIERGREEVKVVSRKTDEIVADVAVPAPALIIFSEFWFFPWTAEVDGRPADMFRAYNILQGTKISPGRHQVRFYFNSRHWKFLLPAAVSGGSILLLVGYVVYWHFREREEKAAG